MFHFAVSAFSSVIFRFAVSTFNCDISLALSTFRPITEINVDIAFRVLWIWAPRVFSLFIDHASHGANVVYNFVFFLNYFLLLRVRNRWRRRPCQPWLAPLSSPDVEGAACKPHRDVFIWLPRYTTLPDACWRRRREKSQCFVFSSPTRPDHALPERSLAANFDWRSSGFRKSTA